MSHENLNLANAITFMRIWLALPLGFFILYDQLTYALIIYVVAAVSDYIDGVIARRLHQETQFGAMLDQLADKILVLTILFMLAVTGKLEGSLAFATLLIILREFLILGFREYVAITYKKVIGVSKSAKWKTALTLMALAFILLKDIPLFPYSYEAAVTGEILLWLSVTMSFISIIGYWHMIFPPASKK